VNKNVMLTLPPEEREKLDRLAKAWGCPRSVAVARLVREAEEPAAN
jgi:predicted DNA-binding protein